MMGEGAAAPTVPPDALTGFIDIDGGVGALTGGTDGAAAIALSAPARAAALVSTLTEPALIGAAGPDDDPAAPGAAGPVALPIGGAEAALDAR